MSADPASGDGWRSAHELVQTRLCASPGCEEEADDDDGLCVRCRFRQFPADGAQADVAPANPELHEKIRSRPRTKTKRSTKTTPATAGPFPCRTPGCPGEAKAKAGRHAFCVDCQVKRGTRRPDGSVISGRLPTSPGSRTNRDRATAYGAYEAKALELVTAGRALDAAIVAHEAARERWLEAEAALPQALEAWRETLERLAVPADGPPFQNAVPRDRSAAPTP